MGSATTLIEARLARRKAIGIDIDPVASLIGKVLTSQYDNDCLLELQDWVGQKVEVLETTKLTAELTKEPWLPGETRHIGQHRATIPDNPGIEYWFSPIQAATLAALTGWVPDSPAPTRDVLRLAISASIIRKWPKTISRARDIVHSRPHRIDRPCESFADQLRVFRLSFKTVMAYVKGLNEVAIVDEMTKSMTVQADSLTHLKLLREGSIDYVLSSPPYFDAIDYPRAHKFSQWWLWPDHGLQRRAYMGLRPGGRPNEDLAERCKALLPQEIFNEVKSLENSSRAWARRFYRYAEDLDSLATELSRVLKPSGVVTLVVGNNVIKGYHAPVVEVVSAVLKRHGFAGVTIQDRDMDSSKRRYPYGIKGFQGLMHKEYIICATM